MLVGAAVAVAEGSLAGVVPRRRRRLVRLRGRAVVRRRTGAPVYALPPSRLRPVVGSAQFLVVAAALAPGIGGTPIAAAAAVGLAALLASFARDWAAATGRLGREDPPLAAE
ncbi:hypothetical protein [Halorubrum sp. CBA1125]|uniref:hypothetical protein n=1 Tax=Halorubrum sp. CBA1125 TaxID=2668072 RepID=UPI001E2C46E3|nr:hypothetical protein [Halorubrum sp. CBA1125]